MQFSNSKVDYAVVGASPEFYQELQEKFGLKDSAYYLNTNINRLQVYVMQQSAFEAFARNVGVHEKDYSRVAIMNPQELRYLDDGTRQIRNFSDIKDGGKQTVTVEPFGETPEKCRESYTDDTGTHYSYGYDTECYYKAVGYPKDIELVITKVTDAWPIGYDVGGYYPMVFVPENYYRRSELGVIADQKTSQNRAHRYMESALYIENIEDGSEISEYIDSQIDAGKISNEIGYEDVHEAMSQMRRMYLLISIFLYGFIAVVTLIGITNIFNTITTNIALRAKEFAMLKSIGMTSKEFNHMVRLESLMYAGKALIIGIPLGLVLSYAFYQSIANSVDFGWIIPWVAILISVVAVGLLISIIMRYSVKQVEKQNIIETIRAENI